MGSWTDRRKKVSVFDLTPGEEKRRNRKSGTFCEQNSWRCQQRSRRKKIKEAIAVALSCIVPAFFFKTPLNVLAVGSSFPE
ncbi:hypothetical protein CEXT_189801 [Caerostris extrusa]|uniref:Uncharacterized protein n=1 Tax=Caerostris extrusa TaxID=172846 RepID=A0AAV4VPV6_CAEEX|nr:hypothetical protein CEXT_189801 [Caerostris extrusa]